MSNFARFNKQREDFPSEAAYNDYLEEYESITFSLIHSIGSDLAATENKIRSYELQNRQSIEDNEDRMERERDELERREKGEREWRESEKKRYEDEEEEDRKAKEEEKKLVLEALVRCLFLPIDPIRVSPLTFIANIRNREVQIQKQWSQQHEHHLANDPLHAIPSPRPLRRPTLLSNSNS